MNVFSSILFILNYFQYPIFVQIICEFWLVDSMQYFFYFCGVKKIMFITKIKRLSFCLLFYKRRQFQCSSKFYRTFVHLVNVTRYVHKLVSKLQYLLYMIDGRIFQRLTVRCLWSTMTQKHIFVIKYIEFPFIYCH